MNVIKVGGIALLIAAATYSLSMAAVIGWAMLYVRFPEIPFLN